MPTTGGPVTIEIPKVGVTPRKVKFVRIEVTDAAKQPFLSNKLNWLEFPVAALTSNSGYEIDEVIDAKKRGVFGYVMWGYQRDDAPIDWLEGGFINWQYTIWKPPVDENPGFLRIWLRKGVFILWQMFEDNKGPTPVSYLTNP